jgi:hypothetical protein
MAQVFLEFDSNLPTGVQVGVVEWEHQVSRGDQARRA